MTEAEKAELVAAWIIYQSAPFEQFTREQRFERDKKYFWAWERLTEFCSHNPELAWELILQINRSELNEFTIACLAAGPVENLLVEHGDKFIERVETKARTNPKFNYLLGGVWQNLMTETVWARVQNARREVW